MRGGFLIRNVQATLVREGSGRYRLSAAAGGRTIKLNGEKLPPAGALLVSGDQISIGPHTLLFALVTQA